MADSTIESAITAWQEAKKEVEAALAKERECFAVVRESLSTLTDAASAAGLLLSATVQEAPEVTEATDEDDDPEAAEETDEAEAAEEAEDSVTIEDSVAESTAISQMVKRLTPYGVVFAIGAAVAWMLIKFF